MIYIKLLIGLLTYLRTLEYLEEVAIDAAKKLAAGEKLAKRNKNKSLVDKAIDLALKQEWLREKFFESAKGKVLKMTGGLYPAPIKVNNFIVLKNQCFCSY